MSWRSWGIAPENARYNLKTFFRIFYDGFEDYELCGHSHYAYSKLRSGCLLPYGVGKEQPTRMRMNAGPTDIAARTLTSLPSSGTMVSLCVESSSQLGVEKRPDGPPKNKQVYDTTVWWEKSTKSEIQGRKEIQNSTGKELLSTMNYVQGGAQTTPWMSAGLCGTDLSPFKDYYSK